MKRNNNIESCFDQKIYNKIATNGTLNTLYRFYKYFYNNLKINYFRIFQK